MEPAEVDKIKAVNLLPITENLRAYILELFPEHKPMVDAGFDYVRFFRGAIYFYSKAYLDSKTLDELLVAFGKAVDFGTPGFQIQQDKAKSRGIGV